MFFLLSPEGSLVNKTDLLVLYLSGTYCHKTSTRPPSCVTPWQPTLYMSSDSHMKTCLNQDWSFYKFKDLKQLAHYKSLKLNYKIAFAVCVCFLFCVSSIEKECLQWSRSSWNENQLAPSLPRENTYRV